MSTKPFTPDEADRARLANLPDGVIEAVNGLLSTGERTFTQDRVMEAIAEKTGATHREICDRRRLDFEPLYEAAGWRVVYDKAAFNETGPSTFRFSRRGEP